MTPTIGATLFTRKPRPEDVPLNLATDLVLLDLKNHPDDSDRVAKNIKQLAKLQKLRSENRSTRVSPDTLAIVLGNLAGVLLIVSYEKHNIVTSKALTFVQKLR
jgi:hypothetical protein